MVGFPVLQGEADGQGSPPKLIHTYVIDKATSWNAVQAILAALFARASGKAEGQHVEIAMLDVGANFFWPDGMSLTGEMFVEKEGLEGSRPSRRPSQVLTPTLDGHVSLMLWPEAPHFEQTLTAVLPELVDDARFADMRSRSEHFRDFQQLMADKFATMSNAELMDFFDEYDLPGSVVIDLEDFHRDPQVQHNRLLVEHDAGALGRIREPRPAPLMGATPLRVGGPSPVREEHTRAVLSEVGFSKEDIDSMKGEGAFGDADV